MSKKIEMVVIRHGETESNRTHIIQGHLDTPLSDVGLKQADLVADYLGESSSHSYCYPNSFQCPSVSGSFLLTN